MGINSTSTSWNFGQMGSAYLLAENNTVTCPEGMAIVAVTFITDSEVDTLVAKDPNLFLNTVGAAHDRGHQTIQVNGAVSSSANIIFDSTVASLGLKLGDEVYLTATGALLGTITVLETGSNAYTITISATTSITNDHYVSILTPGKNDGGNEGTGGLALTTVTFSAGTTIYGRWDSIKLNDSAAAAVIYFGY